MILTLTRALVTGAEASLLRAGLVLTTGDINVAGYFKVTPEHTSSLLAHYPKVVALLRARIPEISSISARGRLWGKLVNGSSGIQAGFTGIDFDNDQKNLKEVLTLKAGNLDELKSTNTLVLFEDQAKHLKASVGDSVTAFSPTLRGVGNTVELRVVAIAANLGLLSNLNVIVPSEVVRTVYQTANDSAGVLQIYLTDSAPLGAVQQRVRSTLTEAGYRLMDDDPRVFWQKFDTISREDWTGQKLDVSTREYELSQTGWLLSVLSVASQALVIAMLLIVGVGLMNSFWIAIRERTQEIGVMRAIGMSRVRVLWLFVLEAGSLGFSSAVAGCLTGWVVGTALNHFQIPLPAGMNMVLLGHDLRFAFGLGTLIRSILFITVATASIAAIPSIRAARLKPSSAMEHI